MMARAQPRCKRPRLARGVALCAAAALAACGAGVEDAPRTRQPVSGGASVRLAPLPALRPYAPREYTAADLTDPFSARKAAESVAEAARAPRGALEPEHRRAPLETHPLEAFTLLGTMRRGDEAEAVVSVGGETQRVRVGQTIGPNHGRILRIGEHSLMLRERIPAGETGWTETLTSLSLPGRAP